MKFLPTGTFKTFPVAFTTSHSLIPKYPSSTITHTKWSSRFRATHLAPLANSTSSL